MSNRPQFFTWKELSQLNTRENAHVAYKGKVSECDCFGVMATFNTNRIKIFS